MKVKEEGRKQLLLLGLLTFGHPATARECPDGVTVPHDRTNIEKSGGIWYMLSSSGHDMPWTLNWMSNQGMGDGYHVSSMGDAVEVQNVIEVFNQYNRIPMLFGLHNTCGVSCVDAACHNLLVWRDKTNGDATFKWGTHISVAGISIDFSGGEECSSLMDVEGVTTVKGTSCSEGSYRFLIQFNCPGVQLQPVELGEGLDGIDIATNIGPSGLTVTTEGRQP